MLDLLLQFDSNFIYLDIRMFRISDLVNFHSLMQSAVLHNCKSVHEPLANAQCISEFLAGE